MTILSRMRNLFKTPLPEVVPTVRKVPVTDLIYALRHSETWPENFKWNYRDFSCCAVGLTHKLWFADQPFVPAMKDIFDLNNEVSIRVFYSLDKILPGNLSKNDITPEMVADYLESVT